MKLSSRTGTGIGIALAASILFLSAARAVAYLTVFDSSAGYFRSATISTLLYIIPILLSVSGMYLAYLRSPALPRDKKKKKTPAEKRAEREEAKAERERIKALKKAGIRPLPPAQPALDPPQPQKRTIIHLIADLLCAVLFGVVALWDFSSASITGDTGFQLRAVLALIAAVSFIPPLRGHKLSYLAGLLQLTAIAWCISCVATDYFDWNVAMNSPLKTYGQFSLCLCALYLSAYARAAVSDLFVRRRNMLALPAAVFGISCGISGLCAYGTGIFFSSALSTLLISLALGIHAAITALPMLRGEIPVYLTPAPQPVVTPPAECAESNKQAPLTDENRTTDSSCS